MLDKLKKFYFNLPKELIIKAIENEEYNREIRRELRKHKTIESKLEYILKDQVRHKIFREHINDSNNKDFNNINELINSINQSNFIELILYMLKMFYDDKRCKEYILSDSYDRYLENAMSVNTIEKDDENTSMKDNNENTNKYIVTIEYKNGFNNIYPILSFEDGNLIKVDEKEYPDYGNINVNPWLKFSEKKYDMVSPLWIFKVDKSQLKETENKTRFKIDGDELIKNNSIYNINDEEIYQIVDLIEYHENLEKYFCEEQIEIKDNLICKKFFIKDENYIYGPFECIKDQFGCYVDRKSTDYIIQKWSIKDNRSNISIEEIEIPYKIEIPYEFNRYFMLVYFKNKENLKSETIDIINDEELLNKLEEIIKTKNTKYSIKDTKEIINSINIENKLSEVRINRIKTLINNTQRIDEFIEKDLIKVIVSLLENDKLKDGISNKILQEPEILRKLQNVEIVQSSIDNKKEELNKIKEELSVKMQKLEQIKLEIKDTRDKTRDELIKENDKNIKKMKDEKQNLEKEIEILREKHNLGNEIDEFKKKVIEEENGYFAFRKRKEEMEREIKDYEKKIKENEEKMERSIKAKLENAITINKISDIAFDGMIANEMLESAAKWSKKKYIESFEKAIASQENIEVAIGIKRFKEENVVDYIYKEIRKKRNYSKNDIVNIMICLTQGFLTVFAGEPGVGKTSICNIIAQVLGLSNEHYDYNRFIEVSVEKGWTSKRDLIGYYNPLTKSFDKNNNSLFKAFNVLHKEYIKKINDFPYYILLDEANLSSMEHYWADFMNVCDLDKKNRKINLGEDYIYNIPKTLRFLATINYDHTTEVLSPRLVDRSWIILLEKSKQEEYDLHSLCDDAEEQPSNGIIMFQDLEKYFLNLADDSSDEEFESQINKELIGIYSMFEKNNISISPRVDIMMKKYLKVGCKLFEKTDSTKHELFVALDYAVAQKLLPKINGYGEEYRGFLKNIEDKFNEKNMMKCKRIIENIIKKGDNNMQYYQFFS